MSQIPSGGAVTIPFVADRSQIDSYLAELRKGIDMPVRAQFVGPGGPGGGAGSGASAFSIASSNGPTTFANQASGGNAGYVGPNGGNFYIGPGGSGFPSMGAGSYMSTAQVGSWGVGGGGQMGQAATQLTQAVQQLSQVVNQLGSAGAAGAAASGTSSGGGGGGAGRFLGLSTRGLARYVGAGFLLHEGLMEYGAGRDYANQMQLAGNNPNAQLTATMGMYNRLANIPIAGQLADILVDPTGRQKLDIQRTLQAAGFGEDYMVGMYGLQLQTLQSGAQADIAQYPSGPLRSRAEVEARYQERTRDIERQRRANPNFQRLDERRNQEQARIEHQYLEEMARAGMSSGGVMEPSVAQGIENDKANRLAQMNADDAKRRAPLEQQYRDMQADADKEKRGQLGVIQDEINRQVEGWGYSQSRQYEMSKRYPSRRELWRIQRAENENVAGYLRKSLGENAATAYLDMQDSRIGLEQSSFNKEVSRERFSINAETERLNLSSGRDARTVGMMPGMRGFIADMNSYVRQNQSSIESALQAGKPEVAAALKARGAAGIIGMRQRLFESTSTENVNPFTQILTGPGTSNMRTMSNEFWKAYQDVQRAGGGPEGSSAGAGGDKQVSENTKQTNAKLDQIINLLTGSLSKIAINA